MQTQKLEDDTKNEIRQILKNGELHQVKPVVNPVDPQPILEVNPAPDVHPPSVQNQYAVSDDAQANAKDNGFDDETDTSSPLVGTFLFYLSFE